MFCRRREQPLALRPRRILSSRTATRCIAATFPAASATALALDVSTSLDFC